MLLVCLYLVLRNIFRKQEKVFKTSVNARPHCHLMFILRTCAVSASQTGAKTEFNAK